MLVISDEPVEGVYVPNFACEDFCCDASTVVQNVADWSSDHSDPDVAHMLGDPFFDLHASQTPQHFFDELVLQLLAKLTPEKHRNVLSVAIQQWKLPPLGDHCNKFVYA